VTTEPQVGALSEENRRASTAITLAAAALLLLGTLVFLLESDSWYVAFKAVHVVAAVLWVGGGTLLAALVITAERDPDPARLLGVARQAEWAARIFIPASFTVLAMGIAMTINGDLDWGQFWLVFGLIAWGISTAIGIGFLTPRIKQLNELIQERGERDPLVQAAVQPILLAARIDIALLLLIVIDMTVKPSF
ncbi:MAG TPA: DUF2269 family protein, partial [Gaiellaceae bacterium]|nr:DUF2269 family protein [Gaiellaceae bacterium]